MKKLRSNRDEHKRGQLLVVVLHSKSIWLPATLVHDFTRTTQRRSCRLVRSSKKTVLASYHFVRDLFAARTYVRTNLRLSVGWAETFVNGYVGNKPDGLHLTECKKPTNFLRAAYATITSEEQISRRRHARDS